MQQSKAIEDCAILVLSGIPDDGLVKVRSVDPLSGEILFDPCGNIEFEHYFAGHKKFHHVRLTGFSGQSFKSFEPDVIINSIANPDIMNNSLAQAEELIDLLRQNFNKDIKVINSPQDVLQTKRNDIYHKFRAMQYLHFPKTVKIEANSITDLRNKISAEELQLPFIMRKCGDHGRGAAVYVNDLSDEKLLSKFSYENGSFYLTEFVETKDDNGLYRMFRLIIVNNKIIPLFYITSDERLIYESSRDFMNQNEKYYDEEMQFLNNFDKILSHGLIEELHQVAKGINLDYFALDAAFIDKDNIVVFEANASQNPLMMLSQVSDKFGYRADLLKIITANFFQRVINK